MTKSKKKQGWKNKKLGQDLIEHTHTSNEVVEQSQTQQ
jgi:hypothetical protein